MESSSANCACRSEVIESSLETLDAISALGSCNESTERASTSIARAEASRATSLALEKLAVGKLLVSALEQTACGGDREALITSAGTNNGTTAFDNCRHSGQKYCESFRSRM